MKPYVKVRWQFAGVVLLGLVSGLIAYPQAVKFVPGVFNMLSRLKVNEGLDLQGGIHLEYAADTSQLPSAKVKDALSAAQAVIERRVNAFGVGEPLVQLSSSGSENRITVELPGVRNIEQAKQMIKETPFLEFRELAGPEAQQQVDDENAKQQTLADTTLAQALGGADFATLAQQTSQDPSAKENGGALPFYQKIQFDPAIGDALFDPGLAKGAVIPKVIDGQDGLYIVKKLDERGDGDNREIKAAEIQFFKYSLDQFPELKYQATGLTGKNLTQVSVAYQGQGVGAPQVELKFDAEGAKLLADLSRRNVGKPLAIFIDHQIFSAPTIQQELVGGQAVVTSNFTIQTVNDYVKRLNEGALPVPITLVGQQSIDASLGHDALQKSLFAGMMGLLAVAVFMIAYYRLLGAAAVVAILIYTALLLALFKLSAFTPFAVTLTLSGIAGFILSIGMAVDANVLIFERTREELAYGKNIHKALDEGFRRAWPSIRDGNYSTLITTFILIALGTGFVKGFAIILTLGVLLSMFTAVVLVRVALRFLIGDWAAAHTRLLLPGKKVYGRDE